VFSTKKDTNIIKHKEAKSIFLLENNIGDRRPKKNNTNPITPHPARIYKY